MRPLSLIAALTLFAASTAAAETPVVHRVMVDHADLDLTTNAGVNVVKRRAEAAAREACGPVEKYHATALYQNYEACYTTAHAAVMAAVDRAVVDARGRRQVAAAP